MNRLIGGNTDSLGTHMLIPPRVPQVGVLTNHVYYSHSPDEFKWLEKTDGQRTIVILDGTGASKLIGKTTEPLSMKFPSPVPQSVLDCEQYDGVLYVFDAYAVAGDIVDELPFDKRMERVRQLFTDHPFLVNNFRVKVVHDVSRENIKDIIASVNSLNNSIETGNQIDGIIFQLNDLPYTSKKCISFKLKRKILNTIDFKVVWNKERNLYQLFLGDRLFRSPYWYNSNRMYIDMSWDKTGYPPSLVKDANAILGKMKSNPSAFDNKIVELSLNEAKRWIPLRVREDKTWSNSYQVGVSNCSVIFSPLEINESYFTKDFSKSPFTEQLRMEYHDASHQIREQIFARFFKHVRHDSPLSCLDVCGGRGADSRYLISNNVRDIFVIDGDKPALVRYVDRCWKDCSITARQFIFGKDPFPTIHNEVAYSRTMFDIVIMNFAVHYLADDREKLIGLKDMIISLLKPGGKFMVTFFDGDKLLKQLPLKNFPGITPNIKAKTCLMALPTIDPSGYREEPLVLQKDMDMFLHDSRLKVVEEYYPMDTIAGLDLVREYMTNIKTITFEHVAS